MRPKVLNISVDFAIAKRMTDLAAGCTRRSLRRKLHWIGRDGIQRTLIVLDGKDFVVIHVGRAVDRSKRILDVNLIRFSRSRRSGPALGSRRPTKTIVIGETQQFMHLLKLQERNYRIEIRLVNFIKNRGNTTIVRRQIRTACCEYMAMTELIRAQRIGKQCVYSSSAPHICTCCCAISEHFQIAWI